MENSINKIFWGKTDEEVRSEFIKFGRGIYENRYVIEVKKQKNLWSIKTSSEFANFFVRKILEGANEEIKIKGIIISTSNIEDDCQFEIENIKKYMGIKQAVINCSTEKNKILNLMNKHPRAFYALSFSANGNELKIKAKPPKSGKPGTSTKGGNAPKADFCSLKTSDKEIVRDLVFDIEEFKEIKIKHTIEINEIEIPKNAETPEETREKAVRRGKIKRFVNADGREQVREKEFVI